MSADGFCFAVHHPKRAEEYAFMPFTVDPLLPITANLKHACEELDMLQYSYGKVQLMLADAPATLVPAECFDDSSARSLYVQNFPLTTSAQEVLSVAVAEGQHILLFAADKPLVRWAARQFPGVEITHSLAPITTWMLAPDAKRRFVCNFHEKKMDVLFGDEGKLLFQNVFSVNSVSDAVYFVLGVWSSLSLSQENDKLTLAGKSVDNRSLRAELSRFIANIEVLEPASEFHATELARIKGLPLDMQTLVSND